MVLLMLAVLILFKTNRRKLKFDSYVIQYIMFIILMGIALVFNGEFERFMFIKYALAYYLVAIIAYCATGVYADTPVKIRMIENTLLIIMAATSVITIMQYFNNPTGWLIGSMFGDINEVHQEWIDEAQNMDNLTGRSLAYGIMSFSFTNAMYISAVGILAFDGIINSNTLFKKIFYTILAVLGLVACFMTQQRSAFYFMLVAFIVLTYIHFKHKLILFFGLIVLLLICSQPLDLLLSDDSFMGRLSLQTMGEDNTRERLLRNGLIFIANNTMWGGPLAYMNANADLPPHNFILNALIYGGLLGGILLIVLFIKIFLKAIRVVFNKYKRSSSSFFCAIALICFLLQGMFHNESLVTGSTLLFVLLSLMQASDKLERNQNSV
nr:O-antigen ligase family protein [Alistipes sp. D31t1_170403_E11]